MLPGASSELATGYWVQEMGGGEAVTAGDKFTAALAAGDVDADGYADLLVGAPGKTFGSTTAAGATYLYRGRPRQANSTTSLTVGRRVAQLDVLATNETNDAFGSALAMGDVTGDGKADAVIGASGEAPPSQPASGMAFQVGNLAPTVPVAAPVESFTPTAAMQGTPVVGTSVASLEYSYTDNIGRLLHGHQPDPSNVFNV